MSHIACLTAHVRHRDRMSDPACRTAHVTDELSPFTCAVSPAPLACDSALALAAAPRGTASRKDVIPAKAGISPGTAIRRGDPGLRRDDVPVRACPAYARVLRGSIRC